MPGESLSFDITANDRASRQFRDVGRAAADAGAKIDFAAGSLAAFDKATINSGKAAATSQKAFESHAKTLKLLADAENVLAGKTTQYTKLQTDQIQKMDQASRSSTGLKARLAALTGAGAGTGLGGSGMTALVGAGVALSGQISTLAFGFGGLGLAAAGVVKPIENAAQKTGGLAKNLHTLDPEQQKVAHGLLDLGHQYDAFQKSLEPQVLTAFNDGFRIAGHLMSDIQPIAKQTGNALNQVLLSVDKEFQSGTWQNFFAFMAREAGPDTRQLGQLFTDLLQVIPPLAQDLHPLGSALITFADDTAKAAQGATSFYDSFQKNVPISNAHTINFLKDLDRWTVNLTDHIPGAKAVNNWLTGLQYSLTGTGDSGDAAAGGVTAFQHAAVVAGKPVFNLDTAVNTLNTDLQRLVGNLTTLQGSNVTWRQSMEAAKKQLDSNSAGLRGNSHDALANKAAVIQSTKAATDLASEQLMLHKDINGASDTIQAQIRFLQGLHDKSAFVKAEIAALRREEEQLNRQRINQTVNVQGLGHWSVSQSLAPGAGHRRAAGGMIPGSGNADNYPALLTPGEVVVPKGMVNAGAVDHLRGRLPGFAAGGIVPDYRGGVGGLSPWIRHNDTATIRLVDQAVASAVTAGIRSARSQALATGFGAAGGGVSRWSGVALRAMASLGIPASDLGIVLSQMATESGGNPYVVNKWDSNWAAGTPSVGLMQVIGPTFAANAGPFRGVGPFEYGVSVNPLANIFAGLNYAIHRYGAGWTSVLGHGHGYDQGGWLMPGVTMAVNKTGRPEQVLPPGRSGGGTTVINNVTVQVGHGTHPVAAAQELVKLLNQGAHLGGVKLRSSILGPG